MVLLLSESGEFNLYCCAFQTDGDGMSFVEDDDDDDDDSQSVTHLQNAFIHCIVSPNNVVVIVAVIAMERVL